MSLSKQNPSISKTFVETTPKPKTTKGILVSVSLASSVKPKDPNND